MMDEPTFVLPFHGVEDFPPESAPLAVKFAQATSNGLIDPVMFGPNITGKVSVPVNFSWSGRDMIAGANSDDVQGYFDVDLSLTKSSIYGRSETVQPASIRLFACIKI